MLDIRFIRENPELVKKSAKSKGYEIDIDEVIKKNEIRNEKLHIREDLKRQINEKSKRGRPNPADLEVLKKLKKELEIARYEFRKIDDAVNGPNGINRKVPNVIPDDTPLGGEEASREERKWGETKDSAVDHLTWAEQRGYVDFERGAKVAGNKFYYLKDKLVELELALLRFGLDFARQRGFYLMSVPHMVNTKILEGAGFSARGKEKQIYEIKGEDLNLIATAEIPLTGFFADEIIPADWLPSKMVAWSPSYRVEGGAYGKHNRGLFRTHQFNKIEMYLYSRPEHSEQLHQELLKIEEEFCQALQIPYRVVRIAAGDLGAPAYKKYDIEYWSPADKAYRELMSCSNCTDYQARRLNIRYKNEDGRTEPVHTLNATLAAMSRLPIAIIENYQTAEGKVKVPEALQPYMGGVQVI